MKFLEIVNPVIVIQGLSTPTNSSVEISFKAEGCKTVNKATVMYKNSHSKYQINDRWSNSKSLEAIRGEISADLTKPD
jgi:hypothetical protein